MEYLRRGEIWTAAGAADYAGKPRPFVIVQSDRAPIERSVTVCGFTSDPAETPIFRLLVHPSSLNGLRKECRIMVDKITTIPLTKFGRHIGRLDRLDLMALNDLLAIYLDLRN